MAQYTIKELEHLSGIKAHTIRIWEQRYNILCPKRTETNIRYYDDCDLKALLNISLLNERGYKISKIAQMSPDLIQEKVQQLCEESCRGSHHIKTLVQSMIDLDEAMFDKALSTATLQIGFEETMHEVIYPFLNKVGVLWQTGNITPAHEHFVSNLIRQKLIVAIDGQVVRRQEGAPAFVLYLPEGEMHELGLLYLNYTLRAKNQHVIYLGQSLPLDDLKMVQRKVQATYVCTVLTSVPERDQVQRYLNNLSATFPESTIFVYGYQVQHDSLKLPSNIKRLAKLRDIVELLH